MHEPTNTHQRSQARFGLLCGVAAYGAWALVTVYFKQVQHIDSLAVLAHRIVWSVLFLAIVISIQRRWREVSRCVVNRKLLGALLGSTVMIAINWYTFIYLISHGRVTDASLGYFMNPLFNVVLGVMLLGERPRAWQTVGIALAATGVAVQAIGAGAVPWLALVLPVSFGFYGFLRKTMNVGPLVGLMIETALLFPAALVVASREVAIDYPAGKLDLRTSLLLLGSGIVTAVPLIWFAAAARRLKLSTLGFLQYLSPTGQFLLGAFVYHESFSRTRLASFILIWIALAIYSVDALRAYARRPAAISVTEPD